MVNPLSAGCSGERRPQSSCLDYRHQTDRESFLARLLPLRVIVDSCSFRLVLQRSAGVGLHVRPNSRGSSSVLASSAVRARVAGAAHAPRRRFPAHRAGLVCGGAVGNLVDRIRKRAGASSFRDVGNRRLALSDIQRRDSVHHDRRSSAPDLACGQEGPRAASRRSSGLRALNIVFLRHRCPYRRLDKSSPNHVAMSRTHTGRLIADSADRAGQRFAPQRHLCERGMEVAVELRDEDPHAVTLVPRPRPPPPLTFRLLGTIHVAVLDNPAGSSSIPGPATGTTPGSMVLVGPGTDPF